MGKEIDYEHRAKREASHAIDFGARCVSHPVVAAIDSGLFGGNAVDCSALGDNAELYLSDGNHPHDCSELGCGYCDAYQKGTPKTRRVDIDLHDISDAFFDLDAS